MPQEIATENPGEDARRYLRHWCNAAFVEGELAARHVGLSREKRQRHSRFIAVTLRQGLEYIESAQHASALTKPLPLFYGAENIFKAVCAFNDATLEASSFKAHGLHGDKARRNSIKNFECKVGSAGADVWSRAFGLLNADLFRFKQNLDGVGMTVDQRVHYATKALERRTPLVLGTLLRHLPELAGDIRTASWGHPFVARVVQFGLTVTTTPAPSHTISFMVSHHHDMGVKQMILDRETDLLKAFSRTTDTLDVLEYSRADTQTQVTIPDVRLDIFGRMYMDFARGRTVLGEPIIYLAALFILADVVRYQADQWNRLLSDHPAEAILVERFLDLVPRKLPNIALNELQQQSVLFLVAAPG
jgi:hypothetical protein